MVPLVAAAGTVAVSCVLLFTVKDVALTPLKRTAVTLVKPAPLMVMVAPPPAYTTEGVKLEIEASWMLKVAIAPAHLDEVVFPPVYAWPVVVTIFSSEKTLALLVAVLLVELTASIIVKLLLMLVRL